jgi:alkanesulfonate monooxygenase SsuD/methylene tetrahydromethanopterin reductase-like flavin-dependent oxidoreductase (luciferase family)
MKVGINIPNLGPAAGPEGIVRVAEKAEELGFSTIWSTERLLWPVNPRVGYGGMDIPIPENYKIQLDPIDVLSYAAAVTKNVRLGTSILNLPFYNPSLLARRITTLDVLSGGRTVIGFGMGWSPEEFEAAGMPMKTRGERADEALDILHTIWKDDPVEFNGKHWRIAKSIHAEAGAEAPSADLHGGLHARCDEACCGAGRRLDTGRDSSPRDAGDVGPDQVNGPRGRTKSR